MIFFKVSLFSVCRIEQIKKAVSVLVILLSTVVCAYDGWNEYEQITFQLSAEQNKVQILENELATITSVATELKDFELFPSHITKFSDDGIISLDKQVESIENKTLLIAKHIKQLRPHLIDAIGVVRELCLKQPDIDMIEVLKQGHRDRIKKILKIKNSIDSSWIQIKICIDFITNSMGLASLNDQSTQSMDSHILDLITSNTGEQADNYYAMLTLIKTELIQRLTNQDISLVYAIEKKRVRKLLQNGQSLGALKKIESMLQYYVGVDYSDELNYLLGEQYVKSNKFHEAVLAFKKITNDTMLINKSIFYKLESWFALHEYDSLWGQVQNNVISKYSRKQKNYLVWLLLESGLQLEKKYNYYSLIDQLAMTEGYAVHAYHAFCRIQYILYNNDSLALTKFKNILEYSWSAEPDKQIIDRIRLSYAQLLFESREYEKSKEQFFILLNREMFFEEALLGLAYCYFQQQNYKQVEITLKKLINQSPDSPRATEALTMLAQMFVLKASYEWDITRSLYAQQIELQKLKNQILQKVAETGESTLRSNLEHTLHQTDSMILQVRNKKHSEYESIEFAYIEALRLCALVKKYYSTGVFQTIQFVQKRERILNVLDSLSSAIESFSNENGIIEVNKEIEKITHIKSNVDKSERLSIEIEINYYYWQQEYIEWKKRFFSLNGASFGTSSSVDSSSQITSAIYDTRIDSLIKASKTLQSAFFPRLEKMLKNVLQMKLHKEDRQYLHYQLGELYYQRENLTYSQNVNTGNSDSINNKFSSTKEIGLSRQIKIDHTMSMEQFKLALQANGSSSVASAAQYSLAWCYSDQQRIDSAVNHMLIVAQNYPQSQYAAQAWMFLGEFYFDNGKLTEATECYRNVMKYPESEWFDQALYKLAWTQYRRSNPAKAISSFFTLVDIANKSKTAASLLENESIEYIALSLSEGDTVNNSGVLSAVRLCKKIKKKDKAIRILSRLAQIYQQQSRDTMAIAAYEALLKLYPDEAESPLYEIAMIDIISKINTIEDASINRIKFFEKYRYYGEWAKSKNEKVRKSADSLAQAQLYDGAYNLHTIAIKSNDKLLLRKSLSAYMQYAELYKNSEKSPQCYYNIAEIYFSLKEFKKAVDYYVGLTHNYPISELVETASWNAIVAAQYLLKQEKELKK